MRPYKTGQGNWQLNFMFNGKQFTLYLGRKMSAVLAGKIADTITELLRCRIEDESVPQTLINKIGKLPKRIQSSIYRFGLISGQCGLTLSRLYEEFLETKTGIRPKSYLGYLDWYRHLVKFFGESRTISSITETDVKHFFDDCKERFSACTVSVGIRRCRSAFIYAVKKHYISENPFSDVCFRVDTNLERQHYVEREVISKVLEHCRNDTERLALVLGRFAGLRVPSEIRELRFCDFRNDLIKISEDTKTGWRDVPLFSEVREVFQRIPCKDEKDLVFPQKFDCRRFLVRAIRKAGLKQWEKLWINLRSSCTTDLTEMGYSEKTLDAIFGNSARVRSLHYVQFQRDKAYKKVLEDNAVLNRIRADVSNYIIPNGYVNLEILSKISKIGLPESEFLMLCKLLVNRFDTGNSF